MHSAYLADEKLTPAPEEEREYYENEYGEQRSCMKPVFKE